MDIKNLMKLLQEAETDMLKESSENFTVSGRIRNKSVEINAMNPPKFELEDESMNSTKIMTFGNMNDNPEPETELQEKTERLEEQFEENLQKLTKAYYNTLYLYAQQMLEEKNQIEEEIIDKYGIKRR